MPRTTIHPLAGARRQPRLYGRGRIRWTICVGFSAVESKDIYQHLYLRRYERSRKHSAAMMLRRDARFS